MEEGIKEKKKKTKVFGDPMVEVDQWRNALMVNMQGTQRQRLII